MTWLGPGSKVDVGLRSLVPPEIRELLDKPVAVLIIGSVAIVSVLGWIIPPLKRAMVLSPYDAWRGQVHRLMTNGWLHGGLWHLLVNMLTLYFFAGKVTKVLGEPRFVVLYLSAVVVASIPTTLRYRNDRGYRSLGASGAVAAVMFSAILLHPKLTLTLFFVPIPVPAVVFAAGYLAYSAVASLVGDTDINHDAHFSGAVYGAAFTYFFEPARAEKAIRTLFAFF
jgi:membrane associated rhomboid family serine protease